MSSELSLDEAKRLVQARLHEWRTPEHEHFISRVTPFEHGWVFQHSFWIFDDGSKKKGDFKGFGSHWPLAVMKTGEVYSTFLRSLDVMCELMSRDWETVHTPALAVELSEGAQQEFLYIFNRVLRSQRQLLLLREVDAVEVRLEWDTSGLSICWRSASEWHQWGERPFLLGALIARRFKQMADIDPTNISEPQGMRSGLIKIRQHPTRHKKVDGKSVCETCEAIYNISVAVFPSASGERIVVTIELDEATSTWASGTEDNSQPS